MDIRRAPRCSLCRNEGHNYRTCGRVETIHDELKGIFSRMILEHFLLTIEEAMLLRCRWLQDYSIVAFRALARKHGFPTNLAKHEYYRLFKRLYFHLSFEELHRRIEQRLIRNIILQLLEEHDYLRNDDEYQLQHWFVPHVCHIHLKQFSSLPKESMECPICYETITEVKDQLLLNCSHSFCKSCINQYLLSLEDQDGTTPTCALCRSFITSIEGDLETILPYFNHLIQ